MKTSKKALIATSAAVLALSLFALTGCNSGLTGGTAATVNGTDIPEDTITQRIMDYRNTAGYTKDEDWANYLLASGMTPETLRKQVLDSYIDIELIKQAAKDNGIEVSSDEIDAQVNAVKGNFENDQAWQEALKQAGYTDQTYRDAIEVSLLQEKLAAKVVPASTVPDDEVLKYASMYASSYNGMKKSSHILFKADDKATAEEVLNKIKNGEMTFDQAVAQYSADEASAKNGGDVGWDYLNSFVTQYTDALGKLEPGQMSDLVESDYGYHIILCTDKFTAPAEVTSLDQLPVEFVDQMRKYAQSSSESTAFTAWLENYKGTVEIVINDMPAKVGYNVDLSKYESEATNANTGK